MDHAQAVVSLIATSSPAVQTVIREFREAGAVSRQTAQRFRARSRNEEAAFAYLLSFGIIRQPKRGRYYLDQRSLHRFPDLWP
jgi:hypothetical protein